MKQIEQNEKDMRRIKRENKKIYKSNVVVIIHSDETSPDFISRINTVLDRNPTSCLTEAMVIGYGMFKKVYVVDVQPDTSPGNNITSETGWVDKVEKYNNLSTIMPVKFDVDGFIYGNIPLKDVTKVYILNIMNSEPQKSDFMTVSKIKRQRQNVYR